MAYRTACDGDYGRLDDPTHLTDKQARELRALWESVPRSGAKGHALNSAEAMRVRHLLIRYREAGVPAAELARVLKVSAAHVGKIASQPTEARRYARTCDWCGGPIPARAYKNAITCGKYCRQARHDFLTGRRPRRSHRGAAAGARRAAISGESG